MWTHSYTDTNLVNDTTYYYVISAVNSLGQSTNSTQASGVPTASVASASTDSHGNTLRRAATDTAAVETWIRWEPRQYHATKRANPHGGALSSRAHRWPASTSVFGS